MMVRLFSEAKKDENESLKAGRPVYKEVMYREIITPGKGKMIYPYTEQNRKDFENPNYWANRFGGEMPDKMADLYKRAYKAFVDGEERAEVDGIPLEDYAQLKASQVKELKEMGIPTVEVLASAGDSFCERYGAGGKELVKRAQNYLKAINDTSALTGEIEGLRLKAKELQNKVDVLNDQIESLKVENKALKLAVDGEAATDKRKSK